MQESAAMEMIEIIKVFANAPSLNVFF